MKKIPLFYPYISWLARLYVLIVLSGKQIAEGPVVVAFEKEFGRRTWKKNVVAVNSGTSALELAFELAGVGPGDEVITPVLTCTATNLPILHRGAKIVFADIDETLNLSIEDVEKKITDRTKAIVYVNFGGNAGTLGQLMVLARRFNIRVIEDAAQSVGAPHFKWGQGDFTCVSLQAIKTLTAGDGGFLICKDDEDAAKARRLRWFGYDRPLKQKLGDIDLLEAGYKYHMNDVNAAIGLGNLRSLGKVLKKRAEIRDEYRYVAKRLEYYGVKLLCYPWLVILIHKDATRLADFLKFHGIDSGPYHYRNDKYSVFGGRRPDLPNMDRLEYSYTLLPFHHRMSEDDVHRVAHTIIAYFRPSLS